MYLFVYLAVFIWRFIDGTLIMFAINRDNVGRNYDGYMYFTTNNISSIVDRFTMLVMIHFVFEMWAVKSTLSSQSYAEKQNDARKQKILKYLVFGAFAAIQLPLLSCRFYNVYKRYVDDEDPRPDVALAEFIARCAYVPLEIFILLLFLYIFRFFVQLKLQLLQE